MSRKLERFFIYLASSWQIITGAITAGMYLLNITSTFTAVAPSESMFGMFVFTYGMAYVTIGVLNMILTHKYVTDGSLQKEMALFWVILIVVFLLLADYVSMMGLIIATTLTLAKNKSIRMIQLEEMN
ncbi:hypothetical protein ACTQ45_12425 [Fundicoccus sp. Sow4_D5]|uniref:hypothetical protein n=1 Tax=unclassified Fundicoccus TaxID=2761543 RepID=UPI003F9280E1